jgi:hypothetical protein
MLINMIELHIINIRSSGCPCVLCEFFVASKIFRQLISHKLPIFYLDKVEVMDIRLDWMLEKDREVIDNYKKRGVFYYPSLLYKEGENEYIFSDFIIRNFRGELYKIDEVKIRNFLNFPCNYSTKTDIIVALRERLKTEKNQIGIDKIQSYLEILT